MVAACARDARSPGNIAAAADAAAHTHVYAWVVEHQPSTIVAIGADRRVLRALVPAATILVARPANLCARATAAHAAMVVVATASRPRALALDCGIPIFQDSGGVVVVPNP